MNKQEVKEKIWQHEFLGSGLSNISGGFVEVLNLEINKRENKVMYDIRLGVYEEGWSERHDDCWYPLDKLEGL